MLMIRQRCAEMPHTDNSNVPMVIKTEDASNTFLEVINIVTNTFFAKLSKGSQILSDLLRVDGEASSEFFRGHDDSALLCKQAQPAIVQRQTVYGRFGYRSIFLHSHPFHVSPHA